MPVAGNRLKSKETETLTDCWATGWFAGCSLEGIAGVGNAGRPAGVYRTQVSMFGEAIVFGGGGLLVDFFW